MRFPAHLRGLIPFRQEDWDDLTEESQRRIIEELDAEYPEARPKYNAYRRALRYARQPEEKRTGANWRQNEESMFWDEYRKIMGYDSEYYDE